MRDLVPIRGRSAPGAYTAPVADQSLISNDVLGRYAADAARDVPGVHALVSSALHRHDGAKVTRDQSRVSVQLHLALEAGANAGTVGVQVQTHVAECLVRMADIRPDNVDVVVDEWLSASSA